MHRVRKGSRARTACLGLILTAGLILIVLKCYIVIPVTTLSPGDGSAYATMAKSIVEGRWLKVDYVSFHARKYPSLPRPEDHWPPLYSFLVAPFFAVLGANPFAAKLPSIIISCVFLPLVTFFLAESFSENTWAALGAAFTVMLYNALFDASLRSMADVTYTFLICSAVLFAVKGLARSEYFLFMGAALGLSFYAKGTTMAIAPAFLFFLIAAKGGLKPFFRERKLLVGLLIALALMALWWLRNYIHFSDPFHSTQNMWSGTFGYGGNVYGVYWDREPPGFLNTKLAMGLDHLAATTKKFLDYYIHWTLVDVLAKAEEVPPVNLDYFLSLAPVRSCVQDFPSYPRGVPIGFLGIPALAGLVFMRRRKEIYIVPLVCGALVLFLSIFWGPSPRFILPTVPLVVSLGWASLAAFAQRFGAWLARHFRAANPLFSASLLLNILLVLFVVSYLRADFISWKAGVNNHIYPYSDSKEHLKLREVAMWIRENTPEDAVIADNKPWGLHFTSGKRTIHTPVDNLEQTIRVLREYKVTHITDFKIWDQQRESLRPLFTGEKPVLQFLRKVRGVRIYKIDHQLLEQRGKTEEE